MTDNITPLNFKRRELADEVGRQVPAHPHFVATAALYYGVVKKDHNTAQRLFNCLQGANLGKACVPVPEDLSDLIYDPTNCDAILVSGKAYDEALRKFGEGEDWQA